MTQITLLFTAIITGVAGAFTPCALGINAIFLGYVTGKTRSRRLQEWVFFALARAGLLTLLGLAFGALGQVAQTMANSYQLLVNLGLIVLGSVFIAGAFGRPLLPSLLLSNRAPFSPPEWAQGAPRSKGGRGILTLGLLFGLDVSACIAPLVLALLAQTVLIGDWLWGAVALFVFGISLSLPLLAVTVVEKADRWLIDVSRRYQTGFYVTAGGLLIVLGAAELWLSFL